MTASELLRKIRSYSEEHPELSQAHHFCFDLRLSSSLKFCLMGINPGEQPHLWRRFPGPTEETSEHDFLSESEREGSNVRWRKICEEFLGTKEVFLSEIFFWSSRNATHFRERFGVRIERSGHLRFCREMNELLFAIHLPRAVIVTGVGAADYVAPLYGLEPVGELKVNNARLVRHYCDGRRPWAFIKHPTAAFGFSKPQKDAVKEYLSHRVL